MTAQTGNARKDPVLVVLQLSGGNDFMNTVVPYGDPLYYDFRKTVGIPEGDLLHIDNHYGLHPALGPIKEMYDAGNVAIVTGVGYPEPDRSHFRSMDIWHTAEPTAVVEEGWLGRVIRELDPDHVGAAVDSKRRGREGRLHLFYRIGVRGGDGYRGGHPSRDFPREARSGEAADARRMFDAEQLDQNLCHPLRRAGFNPL